MACSDRKGCRFTFKLAQTKQQAGMATQAEADYRSADLALVQAMDTYEWAVLGIADVE